MGATSRFSISAIVSLRDRISAPLKRATMSVNEFARTANKRINKTLGNSARRAMMGIGIATGLALREYVKFDDAIFGATARFGAADKKMHKMNGTIFNQAKMMADLRKKAREMGRDTQFSATLMAQGLNKFALAGFNSVEAMSVLISQVDLATVTGEDFMRVADISSDLLGAFGGAALSSAKKVAMLKRMNSLLAVATLSANVTLEDLFETLKQAAPIGTKAGIAMKDIIATASVLGSAGIKGSMAATTMKNMFARLAAPTAEVTKGFKMLGLRQEDFINNAGKLKNTTKIFEALSKKTKGMTDVKALEVFKNLFGLRGMAGAAVLEKNISQLREQLVKMGEDPQKAMKDAAAFMRKSFGVKLQILLSTTTDKFFTLFSAFDKEGRGGIDRLTTGIKNFDMGPIISTLKMATAILGFMFKIISPFLPLIVGLVILIKVWTIAQAALNFVMSLNPIGLIVIAIGALIVAIVALVQNWDKVKKSFMDSDWGKALALVFDGIRNKINQLIKSFQAIYALTQGDFTTAQRLAVEMQPGFTSPNSRGINNTTTTKGTIDMNVNTNGNSVTTKEKGTIPGNFSLNTGTQN